MPSLSFISINDDISEYFVSEDLFPNASVQQKDKNGEFWLLIDGWDGKSIHSEGEYSNVHVEYLSWVIKGLSETEIVGIIQENQDIELPSSARNQYEFLWNEFPWSERCKTIRYMWEDFHEGEIMPLIVSQLQEDFRGIEYEKRPMSNAATLNWEVCETMGLKTSERGVIRNKRGQIEGYNRTGTEISCEGLVVRGKTLKGYLSLIDGICLIRIEYYKSSPKMDKRKYRWYIFSKEEVITPIIE